MENFFSTNIKFLRQKKNWDRATLAEKLNVGLSTIACWENKLRTPNLEMLGNIINLFNIKQDIVTTDLRIPNKDDDDIVSQDEMNDVIEVYKKNGITITMEEGTQITKKDFLEIIDTLDEIKRNEENK